MIVDELTGILECQGLTAPLALNDAEEKKYCEALIRATSEYGLLINKLTTLFHIFLEYRQGSMENVRVAGSSLALG